MTTDNPTIDFNDADFLKNPYPTYAALRSTEPVHWSPEVEAFVFLRHDDVYRLLLERSPKQSTPEYAPRQLTRLFGPTVAGTDGQAHKRLRQLFTPHFAGKAIQDYGIDLIREVIQEVLGELDTSKPVDVHTQLAIPVPYRIATRILGLPYGDEAWLFKRVNVLVRAMDFPSIPLEEAMEAKAELEKYLNRNRDKIQSQLTSTRPTLLRFWLENKGFSYGSPEFTNNVLFSLLAITATSVAAIGTTISSVLRYEEEWPIDDKAISNIVQEAIRLDSPTQLTLRYATEDFTLRGVHIQRRFPLLLFIGSANRDEKVFKEPDKWRPGRPERSSLVFGAGPHICIGMSLVVAEIEALLREMSTQFSDIKLVGPVGPARSMSFRGTASLTIRCKR